MNEDKNEKLSDALLHLLEEEREKRRSRALFPLLALLVFGVLLSVFSYFIYREDSGGQFFEAKETLKELLEENEALAVFLGMDETRTEN